MAALARCPASATATAAASTAWTSSANGRRCVSILRAAFRSAVAAPGPRSPIRRSPTGCCGHWSASGRRCRLPSAPGRPFRCLAPTVGTLLRASRRPCNRTANDARWRWCPEVARPHLTQKTARKGATPGTRAAFCVISQRAENFEELAMAEPAPPSLMGKVTDYILGRNTLIGLASFLLLLISGYATWHGMRDFIIGVSSTPTSQGQLLPGGLSLSNDTLVIAVVVALTFLMWLMLRESFGARRQLRERLITFPLYLFLAIWSIGFGYGFWWSLISGEEATRTGLAGLREDAREAAHVVAARTDAVRGQLDSVVGWSDSQMQREETSGGSCGVPSAAGRGPLYNARRSVRDQITTLRDGMTKSWLEPVQADIEQLRQAATALEGGTVEERQRNFGARASDIRGRARNIAARSNQLGKATAAEMRALA